MPRTPTRPAAPLRRRGLLTCQHGRGAERHGGEFGHSKKLCANLDGFSLHAGIVIPDYCREKLEKLCRYLARPPVVHNRLSLTKNGNVLYKLKRKFRDGSTHAVLSPLDFIARLAALVPRPRVHLVNYFGIFAPASPYRDQVVPRPPDPPTHTRCPKADPNPPPAKPKSRTRYTWAQLMRRVFSFDILTCQHCGGKRTLLDATTEPGAIRKILTHLGLDTEVPALANARSPPNVLPFE